MDSIHVEMNQYASDTETKKAVEHIVSILSKQPEHVVKLQILPHFCVDEEMALKLGVPVVATGLIVQVTKDYKMTSEDVAWFHPSIGRGRTIFDLEQPIGKASLQNIKEANHVSSQQQVFLSAMNSSVGDYTATSPDEFGCEHMAHHLIVDVSLDALLLPLHRQWLESGITAGEVATQWKRMKFNDVYSIDEKAKSLRRAIAATIDSEAKVSYEDQINSVLTDIKYVHFTNDVVKPAPDDMSILVKASGLGGYRMYSRINRDATFYPASFGRGQSFYSWDQMSHKNCARIEHTCSWSGDLAFNTQVMRPPMVPMSKVRDFENNLGITMKDMMKMRIARFSSSDDIADKLSPSDTLKISPTPQQISSANSSISSPLRMDHAVMAKLMHRLQDVQQKFPSFQLFHPNAVAEGRLVLPREIYEYLIN